MQIKAEDDASLLYRSVACSLSFELAQTPTPVKMVTAIDQDQATAHLVGQAVAGVATEQAVAGVDQAVGRRD